MQVLPKKVASRSAVLAMMMVGVLAMAGCGGGSSTTSANNVTAAPTFSPGAGSYNTSQTVTIADSTAGAVLYCTTDGTTPTTASPRCSQPTTVFQTEFLQAIAVAPGMAASDVASAGFTINLSAAATPTLSPAGGTYPAAQTVTISDATSGANIYYTTDGSIPTSASTLYTGPVNVSQTETLSAIAIASGYNNSGVASADYTVGNGTATPNISPAGGTFSTAQTVTITDATAGATIYYTVDGSTPTSSSTQYSSAITVSTSETIHAIAIASGNNSAIATASFTINAPSGPAGSAAAAPSFSPAGGTYSTAQTVTISDATPGASIYYTIDGSAPSTSSSVYNGPITVSVSETVNAIATASGFTQSTVSTAAYVINSSTAAPTFNPPPGPFGAAQTVTISDTTPGAVIYYTVDGSAPTTSSTQYSGPVTVSSTETLQAIAVANGNTSAVTTGSYTINPGAAFNGTVLSGTSPVSGAQVQMYVAGVSGYASSSTALSTPVATNSSGAFALSYSCPDPTSGDLVYLVATGGSVGGGSPNAALSLMTAVGSCNATLPANIVINEVTTVASVYALSQFMAGAASVGATPTNYSTGTASPNIGLANAFAAVTNLVDITTGQAPTHTPAYPADFAHDALILNNSTVPQARINTLANALNACAANGSGCSGLFAAATPAGGSPPTDTLQAILNIAQNPGNHAADIFTAATAVSGPFAPVLTVAPNDWTLALTFTGAGLGLQPGFSGQTADILDGTGNLVTAGALVAHFYNPSMAIDANGNVWVAGYSLSTKGIESSVLAEFNNLGAPLTPSMAVDTTDIGSLGFPVVTVGGFLVGGDNTVAPGPGIGDVFAPNTLTVDASGNVWVVGSSGPAGGYPPNMAEISPSLSLLQGSLPITFDENATVGGAAAMIIDGTGNMWLSSNDIGGLYYQEFSSSGTPSSPAYNSVVDPNAPPPYPGGAPLGLLGPITQLLFDANGELWGQSNDGFGGALYLINTADGSIPYSPYPLSVVIDQVAGTITFNAADVYSPIAADGAGNLYACGQLGGQTLDVVNGATQSVPSLYPIPTGRGCGGQMVIDGAGNIFVLSGGTKPGIIDEFSVAGGSLKQISPASGYTGTSAGEAVTINPDPTNQSPIMTWNNTTQIGGTVPASGIAAAAVDGSGNLWVLNPNTGMTGGSAGNVLVEYIGIAAPVVTPTALALQFGELGVRP